MVTHEETQVVPPEISAIGFSDVRREVRSMPNGRRTLRSRVARHVDSPSGSVRSLAPVIDMGVGLSFPDPLEADAVAASGIGLYSRDGSETVRQFERVIADLEGSEAACATSSGMGALSLTLLSLLKAGDRMVADRECYCETSELLTKVISRFGIRIDFVNVDDTDELQAVLASSARLLLVETISNPGMRVANLLELAQLAHQNGTRLIVDNTFANPLLCRPIEHGADLVVESCGKFVAGHSDVTAGVVAGPSELLHEVRESRRLLGQTPGSMDAWLALRGLKTLYARTSVSNATAKRVAVSLETHPAVTHVRYPGLEQTKSDRPRTLNEEFGGSVIGFELTGGALAADQFVRALVEIPFAATVGGVSTIVSFPSRQRIQGTGESTCSSHASGLVRLSIGLESPADILEDINQALNQVIPTGDRKMGSFR